MEILQPILTRRSIRKYRDTPVEDDKIQAMLAGARFELRRSFDEMYSQRTGLLMETRDVRWDFSV